MTGIIGICMGNITWLIGLFLILIGIWAIRIKPKQVETAVVLMSVTTRGEPKGFARRLKKLIEPYDLTTKYGKRLLIAGIVYMVVGAWFIKVCI